MMDVFPNCVLSRLFVCIRNCVFGSVSGDRTKWEPTECVSGVANKSALRGTQCTAAGTFRTGHPDTESELFQSHLAEVGMRQLRVAFHHRCKDVLSRY